MSLVFEIALGVAAGILVAALVLANWAKIVEFFNGLMAIIVGFGLFAGASWLIAKGAQRMGVPGNVDNNAGSIAGGLAALGVLTYFAFRAVVTFRRGRERLRQWRERRRAAVADQPEAAISD